MSGGQQQRVAIARALVHDPRLIVCDEPTAALDASSGRRVMDLLGEVAIQPNRAVIIVTHDNRVFDLADRIIKMEDGRLTSDVRPDKTKPMEMVH
jgi:putative ABC transport system ATP-binding protein